MPVRATWQHTPIFERELTTKRPLEGRIVAASVIQIDTCEWIINVKVSWREDAWFNVCLFEKPEIKKYRRLSSAIKHIALDYGYDGEHISVVPKPACKDGKAF